MKLKSLLLTAIIIFMVSSPASARKHHHTDGLNQVGDTCLLMTCMIGKLQGDVQPACQPVNQRFFNVRVFTPYYNPEATARLRQSILMQCDGSVENADNLEAVIQRYGRSFQE